MAGTIESALSTPTLFIFNPSFSSKPILSLNLKSSTLSFALACSSLVLCTHTIKPCMCSASAVEQVLEDAQQTPENSQEKKELFVANFPWSYTVTDIKNLFGQCGKVKYVQVIKKEKKLSMGFAFVTMASADEAQAVIDKFDSMEVSGRVIKVEFSKKLKKISPPPSPPTPSLPPRETEYKVYVSNLQWKTRSVHLREFFSANFNPVTASVVYDRLLGRPAGYGFVSFATKEEAEAAISDLNGKELMGRAVRLKYSEKTDKESTSIVQEEQTDESQQEQL